MGALRKAALALFWLVLAGSAFAQRGNVGRYADFEWMGTTGSSSTAGAMKASGSAAPTWTPTTGGANAGGSKTGPWGKGTATWRAKSWARDAANTMRLPPMQAAMNLAAGMIAKQLIDEACVRVFDGVLREGAVWDECILAPVTAEFFKVNNLQPTAIRGREPSCKDWLPRYKASQEAGGGAGANLQVIYTGVTTTGGSNGLGACKFTQQWVHTPGQPVIANQYDFTLRTTSQVMEPTGEYQPTTGQAAEDKLTAKLEEWCQADLNGGVTNGKCAGLFKELGDHDLTVAADQPTIVGVNNPSQQCTTTKTTAPDGSYTLSTACVQETLTPNGPKVDKTSKNTTTTGKFDPQGTKIGPDEVTTAETTSDQRPACEIDPNSTACAATLPQPEDGAKKADDKNKELLDFVTNPTSKLPTFPTLNWSFRLPSGCVPLSITGFEPYLQSIDVCQFLPMFHDIMSVVWIIGGLFGAISMFWRSTLSAN